MEEQRKNSYDPNEDIVDRMWKRSKNSLIKNNSKGDFI